MASPQREQGFTAVAHELMEAVAKYGFAGCQISIILWVMRHTYGYNKKDMEIESLRRLAKEMEMNPRTISKAFNYLLAHKVLIEIAPDTYRLNKDYDKWEPEAPPKVGTGVPKTGNHSSQNREPQFPNNIRNKERKKKETSSTVPKDLKKLTPVQKVVEAWKAFNDIDQFDQDFNRHEYARHAGAAKRLLTKFNGNANEAIDCIEWVLEEYREKKGLTVVLETVVKHVFTYKNRDQIMREEKRYGYRR